MRLAVNVRSVGEIDLLAFDGEIDFGTSEGRQFALLCAPGPVHHVFQTAGMIEQLGVHDSPAEAESALS